MIPENMVTVQSPLLVLMIMVARVVNEHFINFCTTTYLLLSPRVLALAIDGIYFGLTSSATKISILGTGDHSINLSFKFRFINWVLFIKNIICDIFNVIHLLKSCIKATS